VWLLVAASGYVSKLASILFVSMLFCQHTGNLVGAQAVDTELVALQDNGSKARLANIAASEPGSVLARARGASKQLTGLTTL